MAGLHLVTGGAGFVGAYIARELLGRGERVRSLDVLDGPALPGVERVRADVRDEPAVRAAMKGVDFVHHAAALVPLRKSGPEFARVNAEGTRIVLGEANRAGARGFCLMSSSAVFGAPAPGVCPIGPDAPLAPVEDYGRSKAEAEAVVRAEMERPGGLPCSVIRPRTIVGPERLGVFHILFEWVSEGRAVYCLGDGSNLFQLAHAEDAAAVSVSAALSGKSGVFHVGAERFGSVRDLLEALCRRAGTGSRVRSLPAGPAAAILKGLDALGLSPLAPWHYLTGHRDFYFDIEAAKRELGWTPRYSNDETIAAAYDWFLANRKRLAREGGGPSSPHRSALAQGALRLLKKIS